MKRREFLSNSCSVCLGMVGLTAVLPACSATRYIPGKFNNDGLLIEVEDFKTKKNGKTVYRPYLVVRNEELKFPICVYRFGEEDYSALWMECAHQGAEVQVAGTHLQCPAHGSEYDNRGRVTNGPAETGLRTFPVTVSNNQLFIDLRKK
jgi:Rieske Fe-S protein